MNLLNLFFEKREFFPVFVYYSRKGKQKEIFHQNRIKYVGFLNVFVLQMYFFHYQVYILFFGVLTLAGYQMPTRATLCPQGTENRTQSSISAENCKESIEMKMNSLPTSMQSWIQINEVETFRIMRDMTQNTSQTWDQSQQNSETAGHKWY